MGKQYNKVIKRTRRKAYDARKKAALAEKGKPKARSRTAAKKTAAPSTPSTPAVPAAPAA